MKVGDRVERIIWNHKTNSSEVTRGYVLTPPEAFGGRMVRLTMGEGHTMLCGVEGVRVLSLLEIIAEAANGD